MFSLRSSLSSLKLPGTEYQSPEAERHRLVYDFSVVDSWPEDDSNAWESYAKVCQSQFPPVPALTAMRPILLEGQTSALFAHHLIGVNLPIVLDTLAKAKTVTELDLRDNALTSSAVSPLIRFVTDPDTTILLVRLDDNPIGAAGIRDFLDGIKDCQMLEEVSVSNTGCTPIVGRSIADLIAGCQALLRLDVSNCRLRQSVIEIAQALPLSSTLQRLSLARNELFYGQRRLALQFGLNAAKCAALTRIDLSQNSLTSEMAVALLRGLGDAGNLRRLNLSWNAIDEPAGRAIAAFIGRSVSIRILDLSQNPLLNVSRNRELGQQKLEQETKKPGGGAKEKKAKSYVPGCYLILAALPKAAHLKTLRMEGVVANPFEWQARLSAAGDRVRVLWQAVDAHAPRRTRVREAVFTTPNTARRQK